ncbi:alpha-2-macroglobulin family protein, partial [Devosia sp.]|uniref:alpha-2-macroglobulin family protein n=1 Tax=Devosia sp. TaxID=1871048 RepID=UPI002EFDB1FB
MRLLLRSVLGLGAGLFLALAAGAATPAERSVTLLPGIDLPGHDYAVSKDTTLDACRAACEADRACRAFTFNQQAAWCFLKGDAGPETPFAGATSGRIATEPTAAALAAAREAELAFPAADLVYYARAFADELPRTDPPPPRITYADLVAAGDAAMAGANPAAATVSYRQALAIVANDPAIWLKLAGATLARADAERAAGNNAYELGSVATYAALNAFLRAEATAERAAALAALAHGLEQREMWREAIATYRQSVALVDDAGVQGRLDRAVAEHGFRVTSHQVDAEAATPRICAVFSEPLPPASTDLSAYVVVQGAPPVAVETEASQICVEGVEHGRRYAIRLRAGLPSAAGESLLDDVDLDVYVPDRAPFVGFANTAYVMPATLGGGLPITAVNAAIADVAIYRIGDRSIATAVRNGVFRRTLDGYSAADIADQSGEKLWEGQVELAHGAPNAMTTTAIPVREVLGDIQPGAYVVTAKVAGTQQDYWREMATQWFIVTDLGLTAVSGADGVHAFVRSLSSARPVAGARLRLVAVNNEILGEGVTDAGGRLGFAPGLARGTGGRAPQLLVAETDAGDYAFLDLSRPAFDLTDRGVEGRPAPGALDLFATTERGVYRPGETVFLTALLRDSHATAVTDLPLTMEVERPDGVVATREVLQDAGAGGYFAVVPVLAESLRGAWRIRLHADPEADPLASVTFLVEDFEPERLAFEVTAPAGAVAVGSTTPVSVAASYLYGATAPGLAIEAEVVLRPVTTLAGYPRYVFGRADDPVQASREPRGVVGVTDEAGRATAEVAVPEPPPTTRPLEAQFVLRLLDSNGRAVERSLTRAVRAESDRIGIRPRFSEADGLAQGGEAAFDVVAVAPDGESVARPGLLWRLSRVETDYQWYRDGGVWRWEAITSNREVANGRVDALAGAPVTVAAAVDWGRYLLEVESTGPGATSSSYAFYAGSYYPEAGSDTPDTLQVALDKESYRPGETATLRLDPQFAGTALVMVLDDGIIDMVAVEVPASGASVPLAVTADWGPGAYVTAVLYRPASAEEKRMPARALGLAFADVEPGDRRLAVGLEAPKEALPREAFAATVRLGNLAAGEQAYVAVAAVDLGILNLTGFQAPDPDGWFFGQRRLGVELRDLYGQLIDPLQGMPGAIRSGGDGGGVRLGAPPATTELVALHSGIVTVGPDGTATVNFDMPDFNGTVRVMAMAWTASAVGHATAEIVVRDPVVVNLSSPRFLRLGDSSRLLVEIDNVAGAAGAYRVALATGAGLSTTAGETTVELAAGERTSLVLPLAATALGDNELTLTVTAPDGSRLVKELTLGVRAAAGVQTKSTLLPLGAGEAVTIDAGYFAGMLSHSGTLTLAVGPLARLDVPGLLLALDRYPYGCAEQVASRVFPLLYLNDVAEMLGMGTDAALDQRIADAVTSLLAKQNSAGGFGLWGPYGGGELWLDAYVTDVLLRARAEGHAVPEQALGMALDNLANQVAYAADFSNGGEDVAYALYDLARAGRAAIGDLRYYAEARLDAFGTPLAKAQLGAALALYGDRTRAAAA